MPRVLGIDTASPVTQIFLATDNIVEVALCIPRNRTARDITTTIQSLLKTAGWTLKDIEEIVVNRGPGSLTGIRVGLAFSRSLAFALGIPLTGVSGLDALAFAALSEWFARDLPPSTTLVAVLKATADQAFYASYRPALPLPDRLGEYVRAPLSSFTDYLNHIAPALVVGDLDLRASALPGNIRWLAHPLLPTPESLLQAARHLPDPAANPLYLFPPVREISR